MEIIPEGKGWALQTVAGFFFSAVGVKSTGEVLCLEARAEKALRGRPLLWGSFPPWLGTPACASHPTCTHRTYPTRAHPASTHALCAHSAAPHTHSATPHTLAPQPHTWGQHPGLVLMLLV